RGEGDVLGASQWGGSSLKHLSVLRDTEILEAARVEAEHIVDRDPTFELLPALQVLRQRVLPADNAHFIEAS
ncbi:hypothetical protein ETC03_24300, partial [Geobacillus sp. MMMUD3]|nr:hypothetical protein [Geobacillus sp. MMMUD3]